MEKRTLGSIVESKCGKCNDVTGHIIMAMVGGEIVKVECRACGSVHRYRPPDKENVPGRAKAPGSSRSSSASGSKGAASGSRSSVKNALSHDQTDRWREAQNRAGFAEVRPYSIHEKYDAETLINHPVFGLGEILSVISPDKMDVLFEAGIKRLLCNKEG